MFFMTENYVTRMEVRIGISTEVLTTHWPLCDIQTFQDYRDSVAFRCNKPITGNFVMVQLLQYGMISTCEIEVYGLSTSELLSGYIVLNT